MALEQITFNLGALEDSANSGKNYVAGQVFEVFNIDDTYADIFADSAGTIPIDQSGVQNISNSDGECKFFIDKGFYNIKSGGKARQLNANFSFEFETVSDAVNARFISLLEEAVVHVNGYHNVNVGMFSANVVLTSSLSVDDIDAIASVANPLYSFLPVKNSQSNIADLLSFGALTGVDNGALTLSAFKKAVRFLTRYGGGSLFLYPDIAFQDFYLSDEMSIADDNIKVHLYTNLKLTWDDGSDPRSCLSFKGLSTADSVKGAKVYGNGYLIDGNGTAQDANGYVFSAGEGFHSLFFKYCAKPLAENVTLTNGLVDSGKALRCIRPHFKRVIFTNSVHDNGLSFSQDPDNYSLNNQSTWCNGVAEYCESYDNEDFGMTSFNASGCLFINPRSERNGTDSSPHGDKGTGHAGGGLSLEAQNNKETKCKVIDGLIRSNTTNGILVTAKGCELENTNVDGVTLNTALPDIGLYRGHAVALLGGDLKISGGSYRNAERAGVYALAAALGTSGFTLVENLTIEGNCEVSENGVNGIDARGVVNVSISEEVRVFGNTSTNGQIYIHNNPGTSNDYNNGNGTAIVRSQINSGSNASVRVINLNKADIKISGDNTVSTQPIICDNVNKVVTVGNIVTNGTGSLPPNMILVTNCTDHFYWANRGDHAGGKAVNSSATNQYGEAQALGDASGWTDATAQANYNTLLQRLRDAGVLTP